MTPRPVPKIGQDGVVGGLSGAHALDFGRQEDFFPWYTSCTDGQSDLRLVVVLHVHQDTGKPRPPLKVCSTKRLAETLTRLTETLVGRGKTMQH